jgi:glycogen debranching enzyme
MNRRIILAGLVLLSAVGASAAARAPEGLIPAFRFAPSDIALARPAQPGTYFDKAGRKFAMLGYESGSFEAWAWPLKLFRDFEFSFFIGSSSVPIEGKNIARSISVSPAVTTITFAFQSFTVRAHYVATVHDQGAFILLDVDSDEPLTIVAGFVPVLQPMWPAGLGGQYASWDDELKAYVISEPTRKNHGFIGSPAGRGISYAPAHMLSDAPSQFKIDVEDPGSFKGRFVPIVMAGGEGGPEDVRRIYRKIAAAPESYCREAEKHFADLLADSLRVRTPVEELNLALDWAKVAYDGLIVENPDLGRGLVAGLGPSGSGGRPGFGWFFGSDAYINVLSLNSLGLFGAAEDAIAFTRKWQRADGKMAHELSQASGYIDWWKDYPYGYLHGDTTPFFIVAVEDYYRRTGDLEFLRSSWPSVKKAFAWCLTTDGDGDGLMDNGKAGLGALEFGALTGIRTDIYLAAVWVKACQSGQRLASAAADRALIKKTGDAFSRALEAFRRKFWDPESGHYAYAFNSDGGLVRELTPWGAVGLMWNFGDPDKSVAALERLSSADLTTDWGVRMLSVKSPYFEPLNYNYGAAWPFLTSWVAAAEFEHGLTLQGYGALMSTVRHTFDNALGCITEVFSGARNIWPREAVPHQGFCTAGVVFPFVRGLLGLDVSVPDKTISFEPRFPGDWRDVSVSGLRAGEETLSIRYERGEGGIIRTTFESGGRGGYRIRFRPSLGPCARIIGAYLNGKPIVTGDPPADVRRVVRPVVEFPLGSKDVVELAVDFGVEILPPAVRTGTGDADEGLKIVRIEYSAPRKWLSLIVEGLAGKPYGLILNGHKRIAAVEGAALEGARLIIDIPGTPGTGFGRQAVTVRMK